MSQVVLHALAPLDAARSALLRRTGAWLRPLLRDRGLRVAVLGIVSVTVAFAMVIAAPLTVLTLTPLVLGVPHLLSDLRYLVVRQRLHRRPVLVAAVAPCLLLTIVDGLRWGLCAMVLTALLARTSRPRRALALGACALVAVPVLRFGALSGLIFAHLHNGIAIAVWFGWSRRRRALVPASIALGLGAAMLMLGVFDGAIMRPEALAPGSWSIDADELTRVLAPGFEPVWALRVLVLFAVAQSVHYGVWLKLVPEEDRARSGVRSFAASYHALVRDFGPHLPIAALLLTVGLCCYGAFDAVAARAGYLRLALFHGPLEIVVLLLLALEGRAPSREPA